LPALALLGLFACTESDKDDDDDDDDDDVSDTGPSSDDDDDGADELYGPENGWFHALAADVPADLAGTGWYTGDTAYNFTLSDQYGDEVELYQFYGQLVVLDVFAVWCGPYQDLAPEGEEVWEALEDRGMVYLAVTQEDANGNDPTSETAASWGDDFGLTHPILADADQSQGEYVVIGGGFPTFPVFGPDMTILTNDLFPPTLEDVSALMDEHGL
jgi:peroxiredoxin